MKKTLLSLMAICSLVFGLKVVNAANINIDDIDTNTYIIGDRVYELNNYDFSIYDVVIATNEYATNHGGAVAPIYYLGENEDASKYIDEITGPMDFNGNVPSEKREVSDVYPEGVIDATAVNNSKVTNYEVVVEPKIESAVEALNSKGNLGFEKVTYNEESNTIEFAVNDLNKSLSSSASTVIDLFKNLVADFDENVKVTYRVNETEGDLRELANNDREMLVLAKALLESISNDGKLTLSSVIGNSLTIELIFEDETAVTTQEYTVCFTLGNILKIEEEIKGVDEKLTEAIVQLEDVKLGFSSATYDEESHVIDLEIEDPSKDLADSSYRVIRLFNDYIATIDEDTKIEYTLDGVTYDLKTLANDTVAIKTIAQRILSTVSVDGKYKLSSVAGQSLTLTLVYTVGDTTKNVDYVVNFN